MNIDPLVTSRIDELLRAAGLQSGGRVVQHVGGGNHQTFKVQAGALLLAVRLPACVPRHASTLATERIVLREAAAAGIAPPLVYFDAGDGAQISHWVEGQPLRADDLNDPAIASVLGELLCALQRVHVDVPPYDLAGAARAYAEALAPAAVDDARVAGRLARLEMLVSWYRHRQRPLVLSHNDLVAGNMLWRDGRLFLVDWEYAAPADPLFDVASVLGLHRLNDTARKALLQAAGPLPDDEALGRMIDTVRLLAWAWAFSESLRRPMDPRPRSWLEAVEALLCEPERPRQRHRDHVSDR